MPKDPGIDPADLEEALQGVSVQKGGPSRLKNVPRKPSKFDDDLQASYEDHKANRDAWRFVDVDNNRTVKDAKGNDIPLPQATDTEIRRAARSLGWASSVQKQPSPVDPKNKTRVFFMARDQKKYGPYKKKSDD